MAYNVLIQPSGHRIRVQPGESVLEADLREAGGVMPYGCRNGACGACMGRVLAGEVAYPQGLPRGLSARERQEGKALFCQAQPLSDLVIEIREVQTARDIAVRTLPCRVMALHRLAPDVMRLYLKLPAAERLQFLAGQYIDILLRDGRRRGFSLANPPHADEHLELHVRQVPEGEFTTQVFTQMREKAILRFQGPLGTFFLREDSPRPILMIAGGTGFAPLKSMLEHAFHVGITRPIHLYWGARTRQDLYLNELPEAWAEKHPHFTYTPVLSEPRPEDGWTGRAGLVHAAAAADYPDLSRHEVYMAGPPAMIQAARQSFSLQGLAGEQLYFDSFDYAQE